MHMQIHSRTEGRCMPDRSNALISRGIDHHVVVHQREVGSALRHHRGRCLRMMVVVHCGGSGHHGGSGIGPQCRGRRRGRGGGVLLGLADRRRGRRGQGARLEVDLLNVHLDLVLAVATVTAEIALEGLLRGVHRVHVLLDAILPASRVGAERAGEGLGVHVHRPDVSPHAVLLVAVIFAVLTLRAHLKVLQLDLHRATVLLVGAAAGCFGHQLLGLTGLLLVASA